MERIAVLVVLLSAGCAQDGPFCEPDLLGGPMEYPACPDGDGWAVCVESSTGSVAACAGDPADLSVMCSDRLPSCVGGPSWDVRCSDGAVRCGVPGYEPRCVRLCGE